MTTLLAIWGALLSTALGCLALYDRYVKHTGRVRIVLERFNGYWSFDFTRPVRRLDEDLIPKNDFGEPVVHTFDNVFCFKVLNTGDTSIEIRFARIFVKRKFRRTVDLGLPHRPLGDKLAERHDYCVYAVCESNIANGLFFPKEQPTFPAKCYLEVTTTTGRKFRSKLFVAEEVFEQLEDDEGNYSIFKKVDYRNREVVTEGCA